MSYKIGAYYIVTKGNDEKGIFVNDTLLIRQESKQFHKNLGEFVMFLPPRSNQGTFHGLPPLNSCRYFKNKEELDVFMEGIELKYNEELVQKIITEKQKDIDNIKILHGIISKCCMTAKQDTDEIKN